MRDEICVQRQTVFVWVGVVVRRRREVHNEHIAAADIVVGMPDIARHINELAPISAQYNLANLPEGFRVWPWIIKHKLHLALKQAVAILVMLVEIPALRVPGPNAEGIRKDQRLRMPVPAGVE